MCSEFYIFNKVVNHQAAWACPPAHPTSGRPLALSPPAHPPAAIPLGRMPTCPLTRPSTRPAKLLSARPQACLPAANQHARMPDRPPARQTSPHPTAAVTTPASPFTLACTLTGQPPSAHVLSNLHVQSSGCLAARSSAHPPPARPPCSPPVGLPACLQACMAVCPPDELTTRLVNRPSAVVAYFDFSYVSRTVRRIQRPEETVSHGIIRSNTWSVIAIHLSGF